MYIGACMVNGPELPHNTAVILLACTSRYAEANDKH